MEHRSVRDGKVKVSQRWEGQYTGCWIFCGQHILMRQADKDWQLPTSVGQVAMEGSSHRRDMLVFSSTLHGSVDGYLWLYALIAISAQPTSSFYVHVLIIGLWCFAVTAQNLHPINSICILPNMDISNSECHWQPTCFMAIIQQCADKTDEVNSWP